MQMFRIDGTHVAEKLRLKELREKFSFPAIEFSNYEMVVRYAENSYLFLYNYGSAVFFNVPKEIQEKELGRIVEYKLQTDQARATDAFFLELANPENTNPTNRVYFDRVVVHALSYEIIKIVCMLIAESTALEYYENLIENLLIKMNRFAKTLKKQGKMVESAEDFIKFIGLCMDTKQEIISNLYIVDSPDETWDNVELDKMHQELKIMMEIGTRYRALEYKIKIIQESIQVIVEISKSKRETLLELIIILLISFEIIISIVKWRSL